MKIDRAEAKKRANALIGIGWSQSMERLAEQIERAVRETAEECAAMASGYGAKALEEAPHKIPNSCEHAECCEQRSMAKIASYIAEEIRAAFGSKVAKTCE